MPDCEVNGFPLPLKGENTTRVFPWAPVNAVTVGVGGILHYGESAVISVIGAPWTVKTATIFRRTSGGLIESVLERGFAHGPASLTGTTTLTSGVLQLVTPQQVRFSGTPGSSDYFGVFHRLRVRFAPEPGVGVGGLAAAALLVWLGRRRARR